MLPSLGEFSTVCYVSHSQRLSHNQWTRNRCCSGTPLLSLWSNECWQFDLWLLCFFYDPTDADNLISVSCAFSESGLYIWNFLLHPLLKPSLKDFEHYFASMWNEHNCMVVWTFFGIAFLRDWNENWLFPFLWPLLSSKFECSTLTASYFRIWNSPADILLPPLALFLVMLSKAHLTSTLQDVWL